MLFQLFDSLFNEVLHFVQFGLELLRLVHNQTQGMDALVEPLSAFLIDFLHELVVFRHHEETVYINTSEIARRLTRLSEQFSLLLRTKFSLLFSHFSH